MQRPSSRTTIATGLALLLGAGGTLTSSHAQAATAQRVDGHLTAPLEVPLHLAPAPVLSAHHIAAGSGGAKGTLTYAFNLTTSGTRAATFTLADRRDPNRIGTATGSHTFGIVFLDKPLGQQNPRVLRVVDQHVDRIESGVVPATAKSAYVYTTHGTNRSFRYTATT